eukprot:gene7807-23231_t
MGAGVRRGDGLLSNSTVARVVLLRRRAAWQWLVVWPFAA